MILVSSPASRFLRKGISHFLLARKNATFREVGAMSSGFVEPFNRNEGVDHFLNRIRCDVTIVQKGAHINPPKVRPEILEQSGDV